VHLELHFFELLCDEESTSLVVADGGGLRVRDPDCQSSSPA
jgi:hypothetical protein